MAQPPQTLSKGIPFPFTHAYEESFVNLPRKAKNETPPNDPSFVDIFKGKDDADYGRKTKLMTKYTLSAAAFGTMADVLIGTQPKDLAGVVKRAGFWGIPLIGGGLAYTTTVCIAGSIRKKTDQWNHAFGGAAVGSIIGAARKNNLTGFCTGVFFVVLGVLYKESVMGGWEISSDPKQGRRGFAFSHKYDWTMQRNIPGNWYTDPTPQPKGPSEPACK